MDKTKGGLGGGRTNSANGLDQVKRLQVATKQDSKNKDLARQVKAIKFQGTSWVERNYPEKTDDLFVNKKKIEEVQSWLKCAHGIEGQSQGRNRNKILVLTGPSGSGKTATIVLAAKEFNIEVKEWINPMSLTDFNFDRLGRFEPDEVQGRSQQDLFSNFLFRASQYPSLPIKGRPRCQHRLVLVEDFPNVFFRDTPLFHNILRSYNNLGGCPVVFIVPDSSSSDSSCNKLFPKNIMEELNISCISFNPIATTFMVKFLMNLCSKEGASVDKSVVEGISIATGGDIRCAINTLQFKLMNDKQTVSTLFKAPPNKKAKGTTSKSTDAKTVEIVQKDETLFLFRALGKVLYSKRDEGTNLERGASVSQDAAKFLRPYALKEDPENLIDKIEVQADTFLNFLQQNYLPFFGSMDDIVSASSLLADSEYLLARWPFDDSGSASKNHKIREAREEIALLTAARGVMYSNVTKTPNCWRPLKKPMFGDVKSRMQKSAEDVKHLFVSEGAVQVNFFSEMLPFYAKLTGLHPRLWAYDQKKFISEVGTLKKGHRLRLTQDTLQERDAYDEDCSDPEDVCSEKSKTMGAKVLKGTKQTSVGEKRPLSDADEPEEEFLIEDFED